MTLRLLPITLLLCGMLSAAGADVGVKVLGLFTDKALLQIGDQRKIVRVGETFEGVTLESATGRGAVVVIDGRRQELGLNQAIAGNFKKPDRSKMRIYPDSLGMYYVRGEINGKRTRFLVDTGATFVTLSGRKAKQLGLDFEQGVESTAQTAAAVVKVWQIKLESVKIGQIVVRDVYATVIPGNQPEEALLGNSFLRHTTMQQAGSVLHIEKRF